MKYANSRITYLIDEYIHHKRDREIMKMHYVDGISAEIIAKEAEHAAEHVTQEEQGFLPAPFY